jgi:hypothetical protein
MRHIFVGPLSILCGLLFAASTVHAQMKLYGISGQQTDDTPSDTGSGFKFPDHTLFEIDTNNAALTPLFQLTWINDSTAIGFNPESHLIFHTGGSEAYSDSPNRLGHDQGGPDIPGVGYQDSQYMETVDPNTGAAVAIFNADPCPNPDNALPCFGIAAPRPAWILPTERRASTNTDSSFRQTGPDEYHAARGLAWSTNKHLFYLTDELGIFTMTTNGISTFVARPLFSDSHLDEDKAIAFVGTNLWVGHRSNGLAMRVDPETGDVLEEVVLQVPEGGGDPPDNFNGLLGLTEDPATGVVYGVRATKDYFARELVTIDLTTGITTLVGSLGMHITSIAFGQPAAASADIHVSVAAQTEGSITLTWTGGSPKYLVQKKIDLSSTNWFDVVSTSSQTATVAKDGQMGFYRVVGNYTGPDVLSLTAYLSGQGEKPNINTTATGVANLSVAGNTLNYLVTYQGLSSSANNAHIHGFGDSQSASLSVAIPFTQPTGTNGYIMGTATMTENQRTNILTGKSYVNIHSVNNPGGEIRGQAMPTVYTAILNGANERPTPVTTAGAGTAKITILGRELKYELTWTSLTDVAQAGHIHGRADVNGSASAIQAFSGFSGTSGSTSGIVETSVATLEAIVDGMAYVNIHSSVNNGAGEIRGQLAPQ